MSPPVPTAMTRHMTRGRWHIHDFGVLVLIHLRGMHPVVPLPMGRVSARTLRAHERLFATEAGVCARLDITTAIETGATTQTGAAK